MSTIIVDLTQVAGPVYSGRDRGVALRDRIKLDLNEDAADAVDVLIPDGTYTLSSSFFLGLFGPSVKKCGSVDQFERKFRFKGPEFLRPVFRGHASLALQGFNL